MRQYGVKSLGTVDTLRERFYAISLESELKHPAAVAVCEGARGVLSR